MVLLEAPTSRLRREWGDALSFFYNPFSTVLGIIYVASLERTLTTTAPTDNRAIHKNMPGCATSPSGRRLRPARRIKHPNCTTNSSLSQAQTDQTGAQTDGRTDRQTTLFLKNHPYYTSVVANMRE